MSTCIGKDKKVDPHRLENGKEVKMYEHGLLRKLHDVEAKVNEQLDLQQRGGNAVKAISYSLEALHRFEEGDVVCNPPLILPPSPLAPPLSTMGQLPPSLNNLFNQLASN